MSEALEDFPSARVPLQWLLQIVPRLQPRYFSIASSQAAHPGQVHILAALVDYQTPHRRRKRGVCSAWLAGLQAGALDARVSGSKRPVAPLSQLFAAWGSDSALLSLPREHHFKTEASLLLSATHITLSRPGPRPYCNVAG